MSRFSLGESPSSQALRACTQSASAPAAKTSAASVSSAISGSCSSTPMRHFTVTGIFDRALHGSDAVGDQRRRPHQAGAERAGLHAVGRAADIEVDLVIAERLADPRRLGEFARIRAAELQRDRVLFRIETKQPVARAVYDRVGNDHLGIEQRTARQLAMKEAAMPVRPVHHRRDGQSMRLVLLHFYRSQLISSRRMHTNIRRI